MRRMSRRMMQGVVLLFLVGAVGCGGDYSPKPRGYFRIERDSLAYSLLHHVALPYAFEIPAGARVDTAEPSRGWVNVVYPSWHVTLYGSYLETSSEGLQRALADGADLVRRQQSVRRVSEKAYEHPEAEVWGTLYLLEGDCASPIQFMLTDRRRRFFRGALYFDFEPKADSIAPVVGYLRQDVVRLMETFYWK